MAHEKKTFFKNNVIRLEKFISGFGVNLANVVVSNDSSKAQLVDVINKINSLNLILIENSDYKERLINDYNDEIKRLCDKKVYTEKDKTDRDLYYSTKKSDEYKYQKYDFTKNENGKITIEDKARQIIEQSGSNDVIIANFRRALMLNSRNIGPEFPFIFSAKMSNNMSHRLEDEIDSIRDKIEFTGRPKKYGEYMDYLTRCEKLMREDTSYLFNPAKVKEYLKDIEQGKTEDLQNNHIEYEKAQKVFKEVFKNQEVDEQFVKQSVECMQLKACKDSFFEMKQRSIDALMIYQKKVIEDCEKKGVDPYETGALRFVTELVKDESPLRTSEPSVRIYIAEKKQYDKLIKYNSSLLYGNKIIENLAMKNRTYNEKIKEEIKDISKKQKREFISDICSNTIKDEARVTVFHLAESRVNTTIVRKGIKHVDYSTNPYVLQDAFKSSPWESANSMLKRNKDASEMILKDVITQNIKNEEKNKDNYEKFCDKNNLDKQIEQRLKSQEEI